jgi:predicted acetyltransferase
MPLVHRVRPLAESEIRAANNMFRGTLHLPPLTDGEWQIVSRFFEPSRPFGAFLDGELIGTTASSAVSLAVPGGVTSAAAVTMVGVRADRTRRGALTAMMRAQLADVLDRGESVAILHASEATIYGRFGYGPATRARTVSLDRSTSVLRPDAPSGGELRLVGLADAAKILPEIYRRIGMARPGMISRDDAWWSRATSTRADEHRVIVVHAGQDGLDDGYAWYEPITGDHRVGNYSCSLQVGDFQAADAVAAAELWRFLLAVDLANSVQAFRRPIDEPLEWWLTDRRRVQVPRMADDLWLRPVNVPAALAARSFGGTEPVVIEIRDRILPVNSGNYRIGPDGVSSSDLPAQLAMDVDALGAAYLGDVALSTLAAANRVEVLDPAALAIADQVFATGQIPWCGTGF